MWGTRVLNFPISTIPKPRTLVSTSLHCGSSINIKCDVAVIGGGIIGTSIARKLKLDRNKMDIYLLEKESSLAKHQSGHNSGVMHCGVYYKPGSLKAQLCVEGVDLLQKYCQEKNISYQKCGKLIVATQCSEVSVLDELFERGLKNKVKNIKLLDSQCEIQEIAAGCRGLKALWCPQTANVNFKEITQHFCKDFTDAGGKVMLNTKITNIAESSDCEYPLNVFPDEDQAPPIQTKFVMACGGLQSESLTKLLCDSTPSTPNQQHFMSLKVDYHQIEAKYCDNLKTNVYPVPDLELPFLGAHFSPKLDGTILLGPYAMPALKVEGYW